MFDLVNTIQKMAQKRALIAATLLAVNASEFYTQDREDFIEVEAHDVPPTRERQAEPQQAKAAAPGAHRDEQPQATDDEIEERHSEIKNHWEMLLGAGYFKSANEYVMHLRQQSGKLKWELSKPITGIASITRVDYLDAYLDVLIAELEKQGAAQ